MGEKSLLGKISDAVAKGDGPSKISRDFGIDIATASKYKKIIDSGIAPVKDALIKGDIGLAAAVLLSKQPGDVQSKVINTIIEKALKGKKAGSFIKSFIKGKGNGTDDGCSCKSVAIPSPDTLSASSPLPEKGGGIGKIYSEARKVIIEIPGGIKITIEK